MEYELRTCTRTETGECTLRKNNTYKREFRKKRQVTSEGGTVIVKT